MPNILTISYEQSKPAFHLYAQSNSRLKRSQDKIQIRDNGIRYIQEAQLRN